MVRHSRTKTYEASATLPANKRDGVNTSKEKMSKTKEKAKILADRRKGPREKDSKLQRKDDKPRVGVKQPILLGKRTTQPKKWSDQTREVVENVTDSSVLRGAMNPEYSTYYAAFTRFFFKNLHNFVDSEAARAVIVRDAWKLVGLDKYMARAGVLTNKREFVKHLRLIRSHVKLMTQLVEMLGPACLPRAHVRLQTGEEVFIHRIPIAQLPAAMKAFMNRKQLTTLNQLAGSNRLELRMPEPNKSEQSHPDIEGAGSTKPTYGQIFVDVIIGDEELSHIRRMWIGFVEKVDNGLEVTIDNCHRLLYTHYTMFAINHPILHRMMGITASKVMSICMRVAAVARNMYRKLAGKAEDESWVDVNSDDISSYKPSASGDDMLPMLESDGDENPLSTFSDEYSYEDDGSNTSGSENVFSALRSDSDSDTDSEVVDVAVINNMSAVSVLVHNDDQDRDAPSNDNLMLEGAGKDKHPLEDNRAYRKNGKYKASGGKGKGGGNKGNKPAQPPAHNQQDEVKTCDPVKRDFKHADFLMSWPSDHQELRDAISGASDPDTKQLFTEARDRHFEMLRSKFIEAKPYTATLGETSSDKPDRWFETYGSPFCGINCIEVALGRSLNLRSVIDSISDLRNYSKEAGSIPALTIHADRNNVNIRIYHVNGPPDTVLYEHESHPDHKWVNLGFISKDGNHLRGIGHYQLGIYDRDSVKYPSKLAPIKFTNIEWRGTDYVNDAKRYLTGDKDTKQSTMIVLARMGLVGTLLGLGGASVAIPVWAGAASAGLVLPTAGCLGVSLIAGMVTYIVLDNAVLECETELTDIRDYPSSTADTRDIITQRDPLFHHETYRLVRDTKCYKFFGMVRRLPRRDNAYYICESRAQAVMNEQQIMFSVGRDPNLAMATLAIMRTVNLDSERYPLGLQHTGTFLRRYGRSLGDYNDHAESMVLPEARNVPGDTNLVEHKKIITIKENQQAGIKGAGVPRNHVVNNKWNLRGDKLLVNKVMAKAPIGAPLTDRGFAGPGLIPCTDPFTVLSAFMVRHQTKDPEAVNEVLVNQMVAIGKKVLRPMIDGTPKLDVSFLTGNFVEDNIATYNYIYTGKKPRAVIDKDILDYRRYTSGQMSHNEAKKYTEHSVFVKEEDSSKMFTMENVNALACGTYQHGQEIEVVKTKARMIGNNSPLMKMETIQVHLVLHQWKLGPVKEFQVKNMTMTELSEAAADCMMVPHAVTDYSSYESSQTGAVRRSENYVIVELLRRNGLYRTATKFRKHVNAQRVSVTKSGSISMDTRISGDGWTSDGNGINNIVAIFSCAIRAGRLPFYHNGGLFLRNFKFKTEGDDGLVPQNIMDEAYLASMGFSFSSNTVGVKPGDVDFLSVLHKNGKTVANIGKTLVRSAWVVGRAHAKLSIGKQKWLLRQKALSLYHRCKGTPILMAWVNRVGKETSHARDFKHSYTYENSYMREMYGTGSYPEHAEVDPDLRELVAEGSKDFPSIPICVQLEIEHRIEHDKVVYIGSLLNSFNEVRSAVMCLNNNVDLSTNGFYNCIKEMGLRTGSDKY